MSPRPRCARELVRDNIRITDAGCWEWTGSLHGKGYGHVCFNGRGWFAHRLAWSAFRGPIPPGLWVLHRCDNRPCVNPDHLFIGTYRDNIDDMVAKGRQRAGERNAGAKLTADDVAEMRSVIRGNKVTQAELSIAFGISKTQAFRIRHRERWAS